MPRGGKRPNAGRKKGEKKVRIRVPVRLLEAIKALIASNPLR